MMASLSSQSTSRLKQYQWSIFITLFVGYAIYAYNRKSVSLALPQLMQQGLLTKSDAGLIVSSQNVAYAISKFLGGILSDKMSAKLLFTSGLLLSGVATLLFSTCDTLTAFTLLWFLNGFAQGAGWPACAKILRQWFAPSQFGTWWSILSASANVSGGISPFISAFIILNYGWQASLMIAGSISLVLGSIALLTLVNTPTDVNLPSFDPHKSSKSKSTHSKSKPRDSKLSDDNSTWKDLISSPFLWLVSLSYMSVFCTKTSAVDWGQLYIIEDCKQSQIVGSSFTSSLESGGFFGGIIAGYLTDIMLKRASKSKTKDRSNPRIPIAILMMVGVAVCLHLLYFHVNSTSSQLLITCIGFMLGVCLYGPIAIYGVAATESAPAHLSGTAHAIVALAANVGAITSGLPFSLIAKQYSWSTIFIILEVLTLITVVFMVLFKSVSCQIGKVKKN